MPAPYSRFVRDVTFLLLFSLAISAAGVDGRTFEEQISLLQDQLRVAGVELQHATTNETYFCRCLDFCNGRCFAPSCIPCLPATWNDDEDNCYNAGPLGSGLLCSPEGDSDRPTPCCTPNSPLCDIGPKWCDCSQYSPGM